MTTDIVVSRVKEQRAKLGITQQQLAFDTGLSVAAVQSIEGGRAKPNIETLSKLADRFGCTTDYLLGREESERVQFIRYLISEYESATNPQTKAHLQTLIEAYKDKSPGKQITVHTNTEDAP